jgi:hypothetical protein
MVSSGMFRRVDLVRTDVSEEPGASETSVLTRAARRNIPEYTILHRHRRENLKSYTKLKIVRNAPWGSSGVVQCWSYGCTGWMGQVANLHNGITKTVRSHSRNISLCSRWEFVIINGASRCLPINGTGNWRIITLQDGANRSIMTSTS